MFPIMKDGASVSFARRAARASGTSAARPLGGAAATSAALLLFQLGGGPRAYAADAGAPRTDAGPARAPAPVEIVRTPVRRTVDAVPTGGPYFVEELRRGLRDAGISAERIRISVTSTTVVLEGVVPSEQARLAAGAVVDERSPEQLVIKNRLRVAGDTRPEREPCPDAGAPAARPSSEAPPPVREPPPPNDESSP